MRIKSLFVFAVVVAIGVIAASPQAQAAVISVNFSKAGDGNSTVSGNAGVIDAGNWNNCEATGTTLTTSNLIDDTGTATAAELVRTTAGNVANFGYPYPGDPSTENAHLMHTYCDTYDNATSTFTITDIPYALYNLYYYHKAPNTITTRGIMVTVNGTAYYSHEYGTEFPGDATAGDFVEYHNTNETTAQASVGGNYMLLKGLSGDLTILVQAPTSGWSSPGRAPTSGFQIVEVPEPATMALMALGGLGLLLKRRRR